MNRGVIFLMVGMPSLSIYAGQPPTPADIQQAQVRLKAVGLYPARAMG